MAPRAWAVALALLALGAGRASASCQRAPECSCCEYVRPVKQRQARRALASGPFKPGTAERSQSLGVYSAFFKLKLACAAWVQRNKGYSDYACHIADAPGARYRGFVYAANSALNVKRESAAACRSGPVGGGLPMRTNVVYKCEPDPSSPPPPPPSPPAPPPNRTGYLRLHVPRHRAPSAAPPLPADGGSVLTGAFLTVLTVAGLLLCVAGVATFALVGGSQSDFVSALREAWYSSPRDDARAGTRGSRAGVGTHLASDDGDEDDVDYSYAAQHALADERPSTRAPPAPAIDPRDVYGARYARPDPAAPRAGPAATFACLDADP
ncbi:hypothetical protein KFE25_004562 [Diacronema lutheri]|uniref:Uncharacterized protein n=2 Tax=Diacronema lutheri TaxID=2081491 RepID=A0A8J6C4L6_DIALT|nr:hypothetical protein KFE25_004562 [Diacronema lutheri]